MTSAEVFLQFNYSWNEYLERLVCQYELERNVVLPTDSAMEFLEVITKMNKPPNSKRLLAELSVDLFRQDNDCVAILFRICKAVFMKSI